MQKSTSQVIPGSAVVKLTNLKKHSVSKIAIPQRSPAIHLNYDLRPDTDKSFYTLSVNEATNH